MSKKENNIEKIYLLTPMQEGMLFHTLNDKSHAYFTQLCYSTKGQLDLDIFSDSLDILSKRHDVFRTAFVYGKTEKPIQVVLKNRKINLTIKETGDLTEEAYTDFLKEYRDADIERGFDLINDPLIRLTVCKRGEDLHDFIWSYHHILLDGWCHTILIEELGHIYKALFNKEEITLPAPVSFDKFVNWLGKKDLSVSEKYWKQYLKDYDHVARLPKIISDHKIAPKAFKKQLRFSKERTQQLSAASKAKNVTINDIFQTVWALILAKYTNSNDVVYGNVVSGRPADIEGMDRCLGLFINTIPVRLTIEENHSFLDLVQKIHEDSLDSLPHHYNSLADIQNTSELRSELIQHVIAFENYPLTILNEEKDQEGFLEIFNLDVFDQTNYEFDIDVELGEEIEVTFYYNPSRYDSVFVERLSDSFDHLATQFINNPEVSVADLAFVNEENKKELLFGFNKGAVDLNNDLPVNLRFEAYAAKYPQQPAVFHENDQTNYLQLNEKSNQLANLLIASGIKKGDFVGVFADRSCNFIAALLAIFKAGGVYVPLDTQNPLSRTLELIKDSELKALICGGKELDLLNSELHEGSLKHIISLETSEAFKEVNRAANSIQIYAPEDISNSSTSNPANKNNIDDWAYMLYTSGSTGKPKGAITRHDGAMNHILAEYKALELADGFRFLQSASIASDISVWQMLAPLLKGGAVVIANKEDVLEYDRILKLMQNHEITIAEFVPSYLIGLVEYISSLDASAIAMPGLQWMMMVGEEIPVKLVNTWFQLYPECKVLNGYGPCEASDDITQFEMHTPLPAHTLKVPIGQPLANMNIFVLDPYEKLVPIGVSGEICVSGVGVGAGYFKEPEKTASSFKKNPFAGTLGDTIYKTGDLGRWLPDGNLEFMGRIDRQVKIRGNRVELGEIESFIRKTKMVSNVHLAALKNKGEKSLIAFLEVPKKSLIPVLEAQFSEERETRLRSIQQENPSLEGKVMKLEDNLKAFSLNNPETAFAYKEIFLDNAYLQHGIELKPGAVVFDVGANVGIFSMMVSTCFPGTTIYAFEPIPPTFEIMKANTDLYGDQATIFAYNAGLSDSHQKVTFTHYPKNSMLSGRYGDEGADKGYVRNVMEHQLGSHGEQTGNGENAFIESHIEMMTEESMYSEDYECLLLSFSEVVEKHQIERVDLLKIDVERSELDVIAGIKDEHWAIIQQIVIEVHQDGTSLDYVKLLLANKGFICFTEQEDALVGTDLYNIYAVREEPESYQQIRSVITKECMKGLPAYMQPQEYCFVDKIPTNLSDKADEKQLLKIFKDRKEQEAKLGKATQDESVLTSTEAKLKQVWERVLNKTRISPQDDFFEIGGHSLLAMRAKASIFKEMGANIDIRDIFENSRLSELASFIDGTSRTTSSSKLEKIERPERIPLSYSQESIWFIDRLQGSTEYHIPAVLNLKGKLNIPLLNDCIQTIIDRHEILKMIVQHDNGLPYQELIMDREWELDVIQTSDLPKEKVFDLWVSELVAKPFDLASEFKLRATLIEKATEDYTLVLVMHHIASDGWSESILVDELMQLYAAKIEGNEASLPELSLQYFDYAVWQQSRKEQMKEHLNYWVNQVKNISPLELSTDFDRPKLQSIKAALLEHVIDDTLAQQLKSLSAKNGATMFMTLIGAFRLLMYRYTGQKDICIGTPIAGRSHEEFEHLIGFFVNSLTLNLPVNESLSFSAYLNQVKNITLDAFKYQDVPFEKIVEATQKQRDLSRNPIFQVMFTVQNTPELKEFVLGDLEIETVGPKTIQTNCDLHFIIEEHPKRGIVLEVEYCTDLFKETTIARMIEHYMLLLKSIGNNGEQLIKELSILEAKETKTLLEDFNETSVGYGDGTVLELFRNQLDVSGESPAIYAEDTVVSYLALEQRANRLAHYLISCGITKGSIVPVCFDRSLEMYIHILALLKCGAAYVPIDPEYPSHRIGMILDDLSAKWVLTQSEHQTHFEGIEELEVLVSEEHEAVLAALPATAPSVAIQGDDLAYMIYTSGTTGVPKGVMITHDSLYGLLSSMASLYPLSSGDRMAFKTNYGFDVSVYELFGWIKEGGSMVIVPNGLEKDPKRFIDFLDTSGITHLNLVPSLFGVLLENLSSDQHSSLNKLRYLFLAGEALPPSMVSSYHSLGLDASLVNIYGPTEGTIYSTYYQTSASDGAEASISIGKPLPNTQAYVLDEEHRLVPVGVVGELCISGRGIAQGYYQRAELTAAKFIAHPFIEGARLYKTGDLVSWTPEGTLSYVGRKDAQVKLRGYRIELGDISAALDQHPGIRHSVAVLREDKSGHQQLVCYYTGEATVGLSDVKAWLSERLPSYMVPSVYVLLETFPLSSSGKIDRKALPEPDASSYQRATYEAPQTPTELQLASIWSELLQLEKIGVHDNFFELGGHSLLAIRLVSLMETEFEMVINLQDVFNYTTIRQLSKYVELFTSEESTDEQEVTFL
ncbi:amino acid adenylation domain-containing protein [Flavobacteriaceae bacterium M23B6Z8]